MSSDQRDIIIDDLNRLMAEEAEACLRYFQMRFRLRGTGLRRRGAVLRRGDQGNAGTRDLARPADSIARPRPAAPHQPLARRRTDPPASGAGGGAGRRAAGARCLQGVAAAGDRRAHVGGVHPPAGRDRNRTRAGDSRVHECQVHRETRLAVGRDSLDYLSPSEGQLAQSLRAGTTGRARLTPGCMVCSPHRSWRRPFDHSRRSP